MTVDVCRFSAGTTSAAAELDIVASTFAIGSCFNSSRRSSRCFDLTNGFEVGHVDVVQMESRQRMTCTGCINIHINLAELFRGMETKRS